MQRDADTIDVRPEETLDTSMETLTVADSGYKVVFLAFDDKAHLREVRVLSQRTDGFLVDGLVGGESVISKGPPDLKDGDTIKIKGQS